MWEKIYNVAGAKVIWADYTYWEQLPDKKFLSRTDIDQWLCANFAAVTEPHTCKNSVHSSSYKFSLSGNKCFRPVDYGRAAFIKTDIGSYDVKGVGVPSGNQPYWEPYRTGLLYLYEALMEVYTQRLINRLLGNGGECTVRNLAVIQLPIKIKSFFFEDIEILCGLLIRECHNRFIHSENYTHAGIAEAYFSCAKDWEMRLRSVGLTGNIYSDVFDLVRHGEDYQVLCNGNRVKSLESYLIGVCGDVLRDKQRFVPINIQLTAPGRKDPLLVDFNIFRQHKKSKDHLLIGFGPPTNRYVDSMLAGSFRFVARSKRPDDAVKLLKVATLEGYDDCPQHLIGVRAKILHTLVEEILDSGATCLLYTSDAADE